MEGDTVSPPAAGVIDEEALSGRVSIFKVHCKNKITRESLIYPSVNKIMNLHLQLYCFVHHSQVLSTHF